MKGDWVRVRAYGGQVLQRRVATESSRLVYVCTNEEYEAAQREAREPVTVGFYREAVIGREQGR